MSKPVRYRAIITFTADRPLTRAEMDGLLGDLYPQIEEPQVKNDDPAAIDDRMDAEWSSSDIDIDLDRIRPGEGLE
jgi:hypothetical protein